jgi:isoleucyl-tRNA synthetase
VHEQDFPEPNPEFGKGEASVLVDRLLEIRHAVQAAIESEVQAKNFNRNNEAAVRLELPAGDPAAELLAERDFATEFLIVAELELVEGSGLKAVASATKLELCPRCRRHEPLEESGLCARCDAVCG